MLICQGSETQGCGENRGQEGEKMVTWFRYKWLLFPWLEKRAKNVVGRDLIVVKGFERQR